MEKYDNHSIIHFKVPIYSAIGKSTKYNSSDVSKLKYEVKKFLTLEGQYNPRSKRNDIDDDVKNIPVEMVKYLPKFSLFKFGFGNPDVLDLPHSVLKLKYCKDRTTFIV